MTYNVFSGTLNLTQLQLNCKVRCVRTSVFVSSAITFSIILLLPYWANNTHARKDKVVEEVGERRFRRSCERCYKVCVRSTALTPAC